MAHTKKCDILLLLQQPRSATWTMLSVLVQECCSFSCLRMLCFDALRDIRTHYAGLRTERARREWLEHTIAHGDQHVAQHTGASIWRSDLIVSTWRFKLCAFALHKATGAGLRRIREIMAKHQKQDAKFIGMCHKVQTRIRSAATQRSSACDMVIHPNSSQMLLL